MTEQMRVFLSNEAAPVLIGMPIVATYFLFYAVTIPSLSRLSDEGVLRTKIWPLSNSWRSWHNLAALYMLKPPPRRPALYVRIQMLRVVSIVALTWVLLVFADTFGTPIFPELFQMIARIVPTL